MKKILTTAIIGLFLFTPISTFSITSKVINKNNCLSCPQKFSSFNENFDLLIVAHPNFVDTLESFKTYKIEKRNLSTALVTTIDIYAGNYFPVVGNDDIEKIKYFIKNAIENWGVSYVLLIGDTTLIPVRYSNNGFTALEKKFPTDLYYADIYMTDTDGSKVFANWDADGDKNYSEFPDDNSMVDLYPDICLGRLPCKDSQEVKSVIDKIMDFEQNSYLQKPVDKILQLGGDTVWYDEYGEFEGEQSNRAVLDVLKNYQSISLWASLENLTKNNIDDAFSEGIDFVDFSGHGAADRWFTYAHCDGETQLPKARFLFDEPGFTNDDASRLINKKLPIAVICSCLCGQFTSRDCLAWALLKNKNGGSIASFAHSGLSNFNSPSSGATHLDRWAPWLQVKIFEELSQNNIPGEVWKSSICEYVEYWKQIGFDEGKSFNDADYRTVETLTLIGDPSLNEIGKNNGDNNPPDRPTVAGPTSVQVGEMYDYFFNCSDPEGDDLTFYIDWDDDLVDPSVGPASSEETIGKNHSWKLRGKKQIKVQAKDERGAESEWTSLEITVSKKIRHKPLFIFNFLEFLTKTFKYCSSINNC